MAFNQAFDALLRAALAGGESAWVTIYRDLAPTVLGYLRTQGADDADDLTGEVFLQVVRDLPRFEGDERGFRAWVFTIAHRRLVDERRRRGRHPVVPVPPAEASGRTSEQALSERLAAPEADDQALSRIGREHVRELIARLPADQRSVLLLRILGELTVPEVARAIGKRTGAVKALQRRGLAALKRDLPRAGVPL